MPTAGQSPIDVATVSRYAVRVLKDLTLDMVETHQGGAVRLRRHDDAK